VSGKRFFAWVWRINALIVFALGLICTVVAIFAAASIYNDSARTRHVTGVVNVAEEQLETSAASLGSFSEIGGTEVLRAPLSVQQEYARSFGSNDVSSTRNYLYFDPASRESYWLIPGYRGLIVNENDFP